MSTRYNAADIEVLSGLDPVKRRPGMYTDTTRPNHLAQEVIDNAVDEALAGHARSIEVTLHADGSCEVSDDGRGMPVDIHPEEKIPGVELILTRLHAGGKFSNKNYTFSGGLHGVGVSVVNALSTRVEVFIKRDGNEYRMSFRDGDRAIAAGGRRHRRQEEHRHARALLARPEVFRHAEVQPARAQAPAARQGGAVPGPDRHACSTRPAASATSGTTRTACATTCAASSARRASCCRRSCSSAT